MDCMNVYWMNLAEDCPVDDSYEVTEPSDFIKDD
jgi:hypothetical protein